MSVIDFMMENGKKWNHSIAVVYGVTLFMCFLCFIPLTDHSQTQLSSFDPYTVIGEDSMNKIFMGFIVCLSITLSKLIEFLFDIIQTKSRLIQYIPHRFGYIVTFLSVILCLLYANQTIFTNGLFWYGNTAIQCAQIMAVATYCIISATTNPLPFSIAKMHTVQVVLFGLSQALLTWSMTYYYSQDSDVIINTGISHHLILFKDKDNFYYWCSMLSFLCSLANVIIQGVFNRMKSMMFTSQFASFGQVWLHRWECVSFATINLLYFASRATLIWTYGFYMTTYSLSGIMEPVSNIKNLILWNYILFAGYLILYVHFPHRKIVSFLNYTKDELDTKNAFVSIHLHDIRFIKSNAINCINHSHSPRSSHKLHSPTIYHNSNHHNNIESNSHDQVYLKSIHEAEEIVSEINLSCVIAVDQLNDFLLYDKIKYNKLGELEMTMIKPWDFINECVKPFNIQAKALNIRISTIFQMSSTIIDNTVDTVNIMIDGPKIKQVIRNLLSNALKFSPKYGEITVNVSMKKEFSSKPRWVKYADVRSIGVIHIEVVDQGPGISLENQSKIFGQYVQIDANKLQGGGGSGLGLWSSKEVIEKHGGVIGIKSEGEGLGSSFYFELPCYPASAATLTSDRKEKPIMKKRSIKPNNVNSNHSIQNQKLSLDHSMTSLRKSRSDLQLPIVEENNRHVHVVENSHDMVMSVPCSPAFIVRYDLRQRSNDMNNSNNDNNNSIITTTTTTTNNNNMIPTQQLSRNFFGNHIINHNLSLLDTEYLMTETSPFVVSPKGSRTIISMDKSPYAIKPPVLIVDDSSLPLKMTQRYLRDYYNVDEYAMSGEEAFELVQRRGLEYFDMILLDYHMPKMSGPQTAHAIRELGYQGLIIGVTASCSNDDKYEFITKGANAVIVKPLKLEDIQKLVLEWNTPDSPVYAK